MTQRVSQIPNSHPARPPKRQSSGGTPDESLDALVARFRHRVDYFVRRVERRFRLDGLWRDDLCSAGYWGLLQALRNRRPEANEHQLSAYVSKRVEGAVLDEARRVLGRVVRESRLDGDDLESAGGAGADARDPFHGPAPDPEHQADRQGRWRTIAASVEKLQPDHQRLLWAYAEGRSLSEIARRDGGTPARLQSQMNRIGRDVRARNPELRRLLRYEI